MYVKSSCNARGMSTGAICKNNTSVPMGNVHSTHIIHASSMNVHGLGLISESHLPWLTKINVLLPYGSTGLKAYVYY